MLTNRQIIEIIETKADYLRKIQCNTKLVELYDATGDKNKKEEILKQNKILCTEYEQWLDSEVRR